MDVKLITCAVISVERLLFAKAILAATNAPETAPTNLAVAQ